VLSLPIHRSTTFVLVRAHYPENVGAAARALKTMGFTQLSLVKPSRIAVPEHVMARKMAVKSLDVLEASGRFATLGEAIAGFDLVFGTTARRGVSGVLVPRAAAEIAVRAAAAERRIALVLGNEKTGLSSEDLELCHERVRIPMAADQPSINLAQAAQLLSYELFLAALAAR
jgi:TrmH family RNA methyltransferase